MIKKVALIPFKRPVPRVLEKKAANPTTPNKKGVAVANPKKKTKLPFQATNNEDYESKDDVIQVAWDLLVKMDTEGLFVSKGGIVVLEGNTIDSEGNAVEGRSPEDLGLTKEEVALIRPHAVLDCLEVDEEDVAIPDSAIGVVVSIIQLVEAVWDAGIARGQEKERASITSSLVAATVEDEEEDDYDPNEDEEEFDNEDDDVDVDEDGEEMETIEEDEEYD